MKDFGESIDNHQFEITRKLEDNGKIISVKNIDSLEEAILQINKFKINEKPLSSNNANHILEDYLANKLLS
jgi:UDP-N-acetylglucosamine transferase subunit ALG13